MERLLKAREVAELLQVHVATVYRLADTRELPVVEIRGAKRFNEADVEAYIKRQTTNLRGTRAARLRGV